MNPQNTPQATAQPWSGKLERGPDQFCDGRAIRIDLTGFGGAFHLGWEGNAMGDKPEAYAGRIIACVNACAGINPAAVAAMPHDFEKILHVVEMYQKHYRPDSIGAREIGVIGQIARAALALAKGGQ